MHADLYGTNEKTIAQFTHKTRNEILKIYREETVKVFGGIKINNALI